MDGGSLGDEPVMKLAGLPYEGKGKAILKVTVTNEVDEEVAKMAQQAISEMERAEKVIL